MSNEKRTRTVKDPDVRRQEIVDAATELFLAQGYDRTSTNDVMQKLNIAKGTIYHYFESKQHLLEAVADHLAADYVQRRLDELAATEGDALTKIRVLFASEEKHEEEKEIIEQLHTQENVKLHSRLLAVVVLQLAPVFGNLIQLGCEEGTFRTEYPHETAELLLAGIQFLTDEGLYPWEEAVIQHRQSVFPFLIESLLNAEPGSFGWLAPPQGSSSPTTEGE